MVVEGALLNETLLQSLSQHHEHLTTLEVSTVEHSIDRSLQWTSVSLVLTTIIEVVDGVAVGEHDGIIAPLVAQDVNEQTVAGTARLALVTVVGTHHLAHIALLHQCLEGWEVSFPKVAHRHRSVERVALRLRTAVYSIVLGTSVGLEVLVVVALHTQNSLHTQNGVQVRVFATSFLTTSPTRIAEDVHVRTPERQLWVAWIVSHTHWHIEQLWIVVVGTVPVGTCLVRNGGEHFVHLLRVEGSRHTDRLRIDGVVALTHTVTSLTPPVVGRNAQTIHRDGLVHHQTHLLFWRKQGDKILHTLSIRQIDELIRVFQWSTTFEHHCLDRKSTEGVAVLVEQFHATETLADGLEWVEHNHHGCRLARLNSLISIECLNALAAGFYLADGNRCLRLVLECECVTNGAFCRVDISKVILIRVE